MEKILLLLRGNDVLSSENIATIEQAIETGEVDACDLFDDFKVYVSENAEVDYETVLDYQEHYQNLLSHKENLKKLLEYDFRKK